MHRMSRIDEGGGRRSSHPAYPVHPCSMPCSVPRGMTMIELLVALGIFAIAVGSILTIFTAGARHGARAREKMAAGRVALAVFDLVDKGFTAGGTNYGRGAVDAGVIDAEGDGETVTSEQLLGMTAPAPPPGYSQWAPAYVMASPVLLVWEYEIASPAPSTTDGVQLRRLTVTVSVDEDTDFTFDQEQTLPSGVRTGDPVVRVYEAILADRRVVTP